MSEMPMSKHTEHDCCDYLRGFNAGRREAYKEHTADVERLAKELFDSHGVTCNVRGHAVGAGQGCNCSPAISKVELANLKANMEQLFEAAQMHAKKGHNDTCSLALCGAPYQCDCGYAIAVAALALFDQPVAPCPNCGVTGQNTPCPHHVYDPRVKKIAPDQPVAPKETR